ETVRVEHRAHGKAGQLERQVEERVIDVAVFRDVRRGRGCARLRIAGDVDPGALVSEAAVRAAHAVGPAWSLPPPAAPARVDVADPALASERDLSEAVRDVHGQLERAL